MRNEVYSWRVSTDVKAGLEREARRRNLSVSTVLDLAAREWLSKGGAADDDEEEQHRLRNAAAACFGALASGQTHRSEKTREAVRQRLRRRNER
jgi:hypothetical protein